MCCGYKQQVLSVCQGVSSATVVPQLLRSRACVPIHDVYCLSCAKVRVLSACSACLRSLQCMCCYKWPL